MVACIVSNCVNNFFIKTKILKNLLIHIGRIFLALYFLLPGIGKFIAWDDQVALMEAHNMKMIPLLLAFAGVIQIVGGISLLLKKYVVVCALSFAAMTILININLHDIFLPNKFLINLSLYKIEKQKTNMISSYRNHKCIVV